MSENRFKPAWWLRNSHLQTIWPLMCRRTVNLHLERERLELPDGDFIDLEWCGRDEQGPLVMILHGLEGSIDSHYAKGMLQHFSTKGWRGVFMNFRGCSGVPNRLARSYHSGDTGDVNFVSHIIREREPYIKMAAVGVSLGGNVLLKWLGETGKDNPLNAAIAVSVPFELSNSAKRVQTGLSKIYQWYFIRCLRERLVQKFKVNPPHIDASTLDEIYSMYDFDNKITAPLHGFSSAEDYYAKSSSRQFLHNIVVPTLIIHAEDDPLMTAEAIPSLDELSPYIELEVSPAGGHVGFVSGKYPWEPEYWLEKRIADFLQNYFN